MSAYFESGFFTRQPAWHGDGLVLDHEPDTKEAYAASGLGWQVKMLPQFYQVHGQYVKSREFALLRETDNRQLGCCRSRYEILQNEAAFEWCQPLLDSKLWTYETAGSLKEGEICWILLKQHLDEEEMCPVKGDELMPYALISWGHDGGSAIHIMPTTIRVVCCNTLNMALQSKENHAKIRHTAGMRARMLNAQEYFDISRKMFANQLETFRRLQDFPLTEGGKMKYLDEVLKYAYNYEDIDFMPDGDRRNNAMRLRDLFRLSLTKASGIQQLKIQNTMYGVFNAVEECIEHFANPGVKDRGASILYGTGKRAVDIAFELAMKRLSA